MLPTHVFWHYGLRWLQAPNLFRLEMLSLVIDLAHGTEKKSFQLPTINRMLQGLHFLFRNAPLPCPFEDTTPVLAGMFMRKVGTWHWHVLRPFQCKQRNISMAQDCLSKYIDTVILLWLADGTTQVGGNIPVCNRLSRLSSSVAFA
jgi:hypothetical protein